MQSVLTVLPTRRQKSFNPHPLRRADAITYTCGCCTRYVFQSSPAPKSGCNINQLVSTCTHNMSFNPHPLRRADAIRRNSTIRGYRKCFNPHPLRRADAIMSYIMSPANRGFNPHPLRRADAILRCVCILNAAEFQSSPAPKSGCNYATARIGNVLVHVSILTRSEERMQFKHKQLTQGIKRCFNPHPLRRADAICTCGQKAMD